MSIYFKMFYLYNVFKIKYLFIFTNLDIFEKVYKICYFRGVEETRSPILNKQSAININNNLCRRCMEEINEEPGINHTYLTKKKIYFTKKLNFFY